MKTCKIKNAASKALQVQIDRLREQWVSLAPKSKFQSSSTGEHAALAVTWAVLFARPLARKALVEVLAKPLELLATQPPAAADWQQVIYIPESLCESLRSYCWQVVRSQAVEATQGLARQAMSIGQLVYALHKNRLFLQALAQPITVGELRAAQGYRNAQRYATAFLLPECKQQLCSTGCGTVTVQRADAADVQASVVLCEVAPRELVASFFMQGRRFRIIAKADTENSKHWRCWVCEGEQGYAMPVARKNAQAYTTINSMLAPALRLINSMLLGYAQAAQV